MDDTIRHGPNHDCLFAITAGQHGYFTSRQAHECGFDPNLIAYHVKRGRYLHVRRGLYRLSHYPTSPREHLVAAWLAVGAQKAVVSHESALELLGLSDVIPEQTHLTVPRPLRKTAALPGVKIHTTTRPIEPTDVTTRDGIRVTSAARAIIDSAEAGTEPEQIARAIRQAIDQGATTRRRLEHAAANRSARVKAVVAHALSRATS